MTTTPLMDRVIDVDTHEMMPFQFWDECFGAEIARRMAPCQQSPRFIDNGLNTIIRPEIVADDAEITPEAVWLTKGAAAPGAFDLGRREAVMDAMGVAKSLVFPSVGLIGIRMAASPELASVGMGLPMDAAEAKDTGHMLMKAYNAWAIRSMQAIDGRRVRPVTVMLTDDLDTMMAELQAFIDAGVRAVWIPSPSPPANTSPADAALDPFWRLAADNNVAMVLHVGTDFSFVSSPRWTNNVPALGTQKASAEFVLSAFGGGTIHFASENYISAMVLGGVFERVPNLRFGAIEVGAHWLGPLADRLDIWADVFPKGLRGVISAKPSEYIARNVRVTPFHFEPVDDYFERYPVTQHCICYSSDYPHVEGGPYAKKAFADRVARLGPEAAERFFVTNGEWLLPDA